MCVLVFQTEGRSTTPSPSSSPRHSTVRILQPQLQQQLDEQHQQQQQEQEADTDTTPTAVHRPRGITFQGASNQNQNPNTLHPLGM